MKKRNLGEVLALSAPNEYGIPIGEKAPAAPKLLKHPEDVIMFANDDEFVTFDCAASGNPPPFYNWFFQGATSRKASIILLFLSIII